MSVVSPSSILAVLGKARLVELGRELSVSLLPSATKDQQVERLAKTAGLDVVTLARLLTRDELKQVCRAHKLSDAGRSRTELATRLVGHDFGTSLPVPLFGAQPRSAGTDIPEVGAIVQVRHRQYLVEEVIARPLLGEATRVRLVCLDDDDQGRRLDVLWELELGARILQPETHGLGAITALDPPPQFAAHLHALRWHAVTATDARLFQAPFRAGIELMNHQLTPLKKALELPRANLFIADDVGLGKTIEAGLVLQELLLRQQVEMVLIVAPASVCLQWRDEMQKRFGLAFEIYNRPFMARRRQERGFGVNPWTTHNRFIISYQTLRRPAYRDSLLARLGERARKSLLILDEAHTAAPASASKYAIDSRITKVVRDLAPRFDNRLFLSATPHNGHSNSFSALLELLDPQRFTRGVRPSTHALDTVMVRRLKEDLRKLGVDSFPQRKLVQAHNYRCIGSVGTPPDCPNGVSQHAYGNAIDLAEFEDADGETYNVTTDWVIDPADDTCTAATTGTKDQLLHELICELKNRNVWNIVLTPNYNSAHRDHFHVDLTAGSDFIERTATGAEVRGPRATDAHDH